MAQTVGYFENFATAERRAKAYSEGPFVLVDANGWRIEVESKEKPFPVLSIDLSIREIRGRLGWGMGKLADFEQAATVCDALNGMVASGRIVYDERGFWRAA